MAVFIQKHKLFYGPVPKVACTSLKHFFFEIENGFPFRKYRMNDKEVIIHGPHGYKSGLFENYPMKRIGNMTRITVVRDPIERFLSGYTNRVVRNGELSDKKADQYLSGTGLPYDPDLDAFIRLLPRYVKTVPVIRHHFLPMTAFIGGDPEFWTTVYRFDELERLVADVARLTGETGLKLRHENRSKYDGSDIWLTAGQTAALRSFYISDYTAYGAYL